MQYRKFFIGFAILNGSILFATLLCLLIKPGYVFLLIALILAPIAHLVIKVYLNPKYSLLVWASIFVGVPMFGLFGGYTYSKLFPYHDEMVLNISVADASKYQDYYMLDFQNGVPKKEYIGKYQTGSSFEKGYMRGTKGIQGSTITQYDVIPVVSVKWNAEEPVTLWMANSDAMLTTQAADLNMLEIQGYNMNKSRLFKKFQQAITNAETAYGIKSDPNAIILAPKKDPQSTLFGEKIITWFILIIVNLVYVIWYRWELR